MNKNATKLDEEKAQVFHMITSQTLFCEKRARPDLQPTVDFLCKRVREPDKDNWEKLRRMLKFMEQTKNCVLTLSADNIQVVKWWIDGSYAVHLDCESQTGATMLMGA